MEQYKRESRRGEELMRKNNELALNIVDQLFNGGNHTDKTLLKSKWGIKEFLKDLRDVNRNGHNWKNMLNSLIESMEDEEKHIIELLKQDAISEKVAGDSK